MSAHQGWNIYINGKWIDKVFFDPDCDHDYVKKTLIEHDGYGPNIHVIAETTP